MVWFLKGRSYLDGDENENCKYFFNIFLLNVTILGCFGQHAESNAEQCSLAISLPECDFSTAVTEIVCGAIPSYSERQTAEPYSCSAPFLAPRYLTDTEFRNSLTTVESVLMFVNLFPDVNFPKLERVLHAIQANQFSITENVFPALIEAGSIDIGFSSAQAYFPKLKMVTGSISIISTELDAIKFPLLSDVGGKIWLRGAYSNSSFPHLVTVGGSLIFSPNPKSEAEFPRLNKVKSLSISGYVRTFDSFFVLEKIEESLWLQDIPGIYADSSTPLTVSSPAGHFKNLKYIGGSMSIRDTSLINLDIFPIIEPIEPRFINVIGNPNLVSIMGLTEKLLLAEKVLFSNNISICNSAIASAFDDLETGTLDIRDNKDC